MNTLQRSSTINQGLLRRRRSSVEWSLRLSQTCHPQFLDQLRQLRQFRNQALYHIEGAFHGVQRRSSRRISNATIAEIASLQQVEKPDEVKTRLTPSQMKEDNYDHRRFVEERYMDTPYHYASEQRNKDFHETFKSVPKDDRLLDDFNCGLNRELLYQGNYT